VATVQFNYKKNGSWADEEITEPIVTQHFRNISTDMYLSCFNGHYHPPDTGGNIAILSPSFKDKFLPAILQFTAN
jgi:hypothetical protein